VLNLILVVYYFVFSLIFSHIKLQRSPA